MLQDAAPANVRDPELAEALAAELGGSWPGRLEAWHALGSTSDRLRELARSGAAAWSVVLARQQAGGRGRGGRRWESPPGNLYVSVLLPEAGPRPGLLPLACGVAVGETLAGWGVAAELKWPNDVLAGGRKLAGLLVEAGSTGGRIQDVTVGVGANLEQAPPLPPDALQEATSVRAAGGRPPALAAAAAGVLRAVAAWHARLLGEPGAVVEAWRSRAVDWWGEPVEFRTAGQTLRGRLLGLESDGSLLVEDEAGSRRCVAAGEMLRLRRA